MCVFLFTQGPFQESPEVYSTEHLQESDVTRSYVRKNITGEVVDH